MSCKEYRSFFQTLHEGLLSINKSSNTEIISNGLKYIHDDIVVDSVSCIIESDNIVYLRCYISNADQYDMLYTLLMAKNIDFHSFDEKIFISLKSLCEYFDTLYSQEIIDQVIVEEAEKSNDELFFSKLMELERRIEILENGKSCCKHHGD